MEAYINPETSEILCPACKKNDFKAFRRHKDSEEIYLNQCKCESCGQLFVYKVDKKNNIILDKKAG